MTQKLILPINKCRLTASWKTVAYKIKFHFEHYGADMAGTARDRTVFASGSGTVVAAGRDKVVGNVVAVVYPGALNRRTGKVQDLVLRYFHLESIAVKAGQPVGKDTRLGLYGNTGLMKMAYHLHLEADTDIRRPLYSPTVNNSNFLKGRAAGANDRTMSSPLDWLHCKTDAPDFQAYSTTNDAYIAQADKTIPNVTGTLIDKSGASEIEQLKAENARLQKELSDLQAIVADKDAKLRQICEISA